MTVATLVVTFCLTTAEPAAAEPPTAGPGEITGLVVNASQRYTPCAGTEVVLRVQENGQFVPLAEAVTDASGRYRFRGLRLGRSYVYLPGANRADVHYPGTRVRLTGAEPVADVLLQVRDAVTGPSPLVLRQHEIVLRPEPGALHVTEAMVVDNPTPATYVGQAAEEGGEAVTLRLAIPRDVERVTFFQEFYGRQFGIDNGLLVTGIPWTPGPRDVKFMYTVRTDRPYHLWQRPLDLPCDQVRLHVVHDRPDEIASNLDPGHGARAGEKVFTSRGQTLPAGYVLRVELGQLPVPWTTYGRWAALVLLAGSVAGTAAVLARRNRVRRAAATPASGPEAPAITTAPSRRHRRRQAQGRRAA